MRIRLKRTRGKRNRDDKGREGRCGINLESEEPSRSGGVRRTLDEDTRDQILHKGPSFGLIRLYCDLSTNKGKEFLVLECI